MIIAHGIGSAISVVRGIGFVGGIMRGVNAISSVASSISDSTRVITDIFARTLCVVAWTSATALGVFLCLNPLTLIFGVMLLVVCSCGAVVFVRGELSRRRIAEQARPQATVQPTPKETTEAVRETTIRLRFNPMKGADQSSESRAIVAPRQFPQGDAPHRLYIEPSIEKLIMGALAGRITTAADDEAMVSVKPYTVTESDFKGLRSPLTTNAFHCDGFFELEIVVRERTKKRRSTVSPAVKDFASAAAGLALDIAYSPFKMIREATEPFKVAHDVLVGRLHE